MSKQILCVDPGPQSSGYAILDIDNWEVVDHGTADWDTLCDYTTNYDIVGVAVEKIIMYVFPGKASPNNKNVVFTAFQTGRLFQICQQRDLQYRELVRIDIIERILGKSARGKGNTTTKAQMQDEIKKLLDLDQAIRPQHANDAVCAGVVLWEHPYVKKQIKKLEKGKKK